MTASIAGPALLLVAAWTSGFSVYLTAALLGIGGRAGWYELPGALTNLEHPLVIAAALFLFFIEFFADKVPVVDSMWDSIHTFIRPVAAAALAFLGTQGEGTIAQTFFTLVSGTLALGAHTAKATTRLAINTSPEPFSNIAASLAEQISVVFLLWFVAAHPGWALLLLAVLVIGAAVLVRTLWRFARRVFGGKSKASA